MHTYNTIIPRNYIIIKTYKINIIKFNFKYKNIIMIFFSMLVLWWLLKKISINIFMSLIIQLKIIQANKLITILMIQYFDYLLMVYDILITWYCNNNHKFDDLTL